MIIIIVLYQFIFSIDKCCILHKNKNENFFIHSIKMMPLIYRILFSSKRNYNQLKFIFLIDESAIFFSNIYKGLIFFIIKKLIA